MIHLPPPIRPPLLRLLAEQGRSVELEQQRRLFEEEEEGGAGGEEGSAADDGMEEEQQQQTVDEELRRLRNEVAHLRRQVELLTLKTECSICMDDQVHAYKIK
jgi:hypothetical protein